MPIDTKDFPPRKPTVAIGIMKPEMGVIPIPKGMDTEDRKPGETIQVVVEAKILPDGKMQVVTVNGMPIDGSSEPDEDDMPNDDKESFANRVMPDDTGEGGM